MKNTYRYGIKKILALLIMLIMAFYDTSLAVQKGKKVEFEGGKMGTVIFDGTKHLDAGYHCIDCHNKLFMMKKNHSRIIYADHSARKGYCFACHNSTTAFDAVGNCYRCHKRKQ
jgi:c(7)-type cytochrome triheme protein